MTAHLSVLHLLTIDQRPGPVSEEVGADKRLGLEQARGPVEPRVQQLIDHVIEHGYVVMPHAFSATAIAKAKAEVARLAAGTCDDAGPAAKKGRNTFEGLRTQCIYALANKSRAFDGFALHPDVLALNDWFLNRGYLVGSFQSINILPGERRQTLHHDDGYVTVPRPHRPFVTGVMVALDDYTCSNGATAIVPGSHTWDPDRLPRRPEAIPVVMPSGSIMLFLGTLWHGGGANRLALTVQYCQPWLRPLENQIPAVEWEKLDEISPRLVDMLGYKVGSLCVGHVDGVSPRTAVTRLLEKRKRERGSDAKL